jgi:hypothetical protein
MRLEETNINGRISDATEKRSIDQWGQLILAN